MRVLGVVAGIVAVLLIVCLTLALCLLPGAPGVAYAQLEVEDFTVHVEPVADLDSQAETLLSEVTTTEARAEVSYSIETSRTSNPNIYAGPTTAASPGYGLPRELGRFSAGVSSAAPSHAT